MHRSFAAIIAALILATPVCGWAADSRETKPKPAAAKPAQKSGKSGNIFSDTRKFLAEKSAKTAEVIKGNVDRLRKKVGSEPEAVPDKKTKDKKSRKAGKDRK